VSIERHPSVIRILHWLVAAMIIAALVMSTFVMSKIPNADPEKVSALIRHMTVGMLILLFTFLRFFVRRKKTRLISLPSGMVWADWLASVVHRLLNVLVIVMVGSGIGVALLSGVPDIVLGGKAQALGSFDQLPLFILHRITALILFAALALHAGGALYHQLLLRDGLMSRMWFGFGWPRRGGALRTPCNGGKAPRARPENCMADEALEARH
jgi:cytochrome b561